MTATGQNFSIYAGDTCAVTITVLDEDGDPKSIIGSTINWVAYHGDTVYLTKTTSSGITLSDPANGEFEISFVPADTESMGIGAYTHEAEVTDSSGNVSTVTVGTMTVLRSKA